MKSIYSLFLLFIILFTACNKDNDKTSLAQSAANNINKSATVSGQFGTSYIDGTQGNAEVQLSNISDSVSQIKCNIVDKNKEKIGEILISKIQLTGENNNVDIKKQDVTGSITNNSQTMKNVDLSVSGNINQHTYYMILKGLDDTQNIDIKIESKGILID